ncbi:hypothetical protein [Leptospira interrogans]|uniref:hypothetical protein n=1 Tax=Leptospira interrogans TaxID=173 RepID=UPI0002785E69|nr:hypothetical protein [Leptospira interrogans]EJP17957.1 hypothetical protein LEP1GSC080_2833 [Leptospira interrogans str. FPW2026]
MIQSSSATASFYIFFDCTEYLGNEYPTTLYLKTILSLLGEEIRGKVREEYEILNPAKICDSV